MQKMSNVCEVITILLLMVSWVPTASVAYSIPNDTTIGTWDPVSRVYTLNEGVHQDINITIDEDNLTLDGAGCTVLGSGAGTGVLLSQRTGIIVGNLTVSGSGAGTGVLLYGSTDITVKNLTVQGFQCGISLSMSADNFIKDSNVISNAYGIRLYNLSNSNEVTGNTVSSSNHGLELYSSHGNEVTGNTVISSSVYGIYLSSSSSNQIYNNGFIDNTMQACVEGGSGNSFSLDEPLGGNYWSDWTGPDDDGDGFVDSPYVFGGGQDELPWVNQDGWGNDPPIAEAGPDQTVILGESVQFDGSGSSDPDGTVVSYQWEFGNPTSTGSGVVVTYAYSMEGIYTVTLTVTDDRDATGADTAIVTVLTPAGAINDVIGVIEDMNLVKDSGLSAKLEGAQDALNAKIDGTYNDVINKLEAFINAVEAQRGKSLTNEQADELVDYVTRIILALGGGSAAPSIMSPLPQTACLLLAYPIPSNPDVWIPYQLGADSSVVIRIHDLSGRLIRTFDLGYRPAGHYISKDKAAYWDGRNEIGEEVASGIYFYSITAGDFSATKKMILAK